MHDWFVGLVLEVAVPTTSEVRSWPRLHFLKLFLSGADLHSGLYSVGSKWTCSLEVPFVKHSLLDCRVTSSEVIETLGVGLGTVHYEALKNMFSRKASNTGGTHLRRSSNGLGSLDQHPEGQQ